MEKLLSTLLLNKRGYPDGYPGAHNLVLPKATPESIFPLPVGESPKAWAELSRGVSSIGIALIIS